MELNKEDVVAGSSPAGTAILDLSQETCPSNIYPTNYTLTRIEVTEVNKQYETYWYS